MRHDEWCHEWCHPVIQSYSTAYMIRWGRNDARTDSYVNAHMPSGRSFTTNGIIEYLIWCIRRCIRRFPYLVIYLLSYDYDYISPSLCKSISAIPRGDFLSALQPRPRFSPIHVIVPSVKPCPVTARFARFPLQPDSQDYYN